MYIKKPIAILRDGVLFSISSGFDFVFFCDTGADLICRFFFQLFIERSKNNFWVANKLLVSLLTRKERTNNASSRVDGGTKFKFR